MRFSMGNCFAVAALLAGTMLFAGCISSTTVYDDEEPTTVKKTTVKKTTVKGTGSSSSVIIVQHQFYYYPSCQVYRSCDSNSWYWYEGGVWKTSSKLPKALVIGEEVPYVVMLESNKPKDHHAVIVKQYPPRRLESHEEEVRMGEKSLPPHARGKAKGHDKQNARRFAEEESQREPQDGQIAAEHKNGNADTSEKVDKSNRSDKADDQNGQGKNHEDGDRGNSGAADNASDKSSDDAKGSEKGSDKESDKGNGNGKDKDDDKGKSSDKKDKSEKGKGKGKD